MGLTSALFSSVSGLDTTSTAITIVGDNIANVNTPGFKERRPEFADVLGQSIASVGGSSQLGAGARVARVSTIFTQGTFESSGKSTDLAIEGQGFFIVEGWFTVLAQTDPRDVGGILEALGIVLLILSTRAPRGPEPALTTTRDKSRLWRRALRDFFVSEDEKGGAR